MFVNFTTQETKVICRISMKFNSNTFFLRFTKNFLCFAMRSLYYIIRYVYGYEDACMFILRSVFFSFLQLLVGILCKAFLQFYTAHFMDIGVNGVFFFLLYISSNFFRFFFLYFKWSKSVAISISISFYRMLDFSIYNCCESMRMQTVVEASGCRNEMLDVHCTSMHLFMNSGKVFCSQYFFFIFLVCVWVCLWSVFSLVFEGEMTLRLTCRNRIGASPKI